MGVALVPSPPRLRPPWPSGSSPSPAAGGQLHSGGAWAMHTTVPLKLLRAKVAADPTRALRSRDALALHHRRERGAAGSTAA